MNRLFTLEDWVSELLTLSTTELNARFSEYDSAEREIQALPFFSRRRWQFRRVAQPLLETLAAKIREINCEEIIWFGLFCYLESGLPEAIAHDLIDRDVVVVALAHSARQADSVQWRLADLVDEALLTLGKEIYGWGQHSTEELRDVLEKYSTHYWLLSSLAHSRASSLEKSALLEEFLLRHSDSVRLMEIKKTMSRDILPRNSARPWQQIGSSPPPEQVEELYGTRTLEELKTLASSPQTPREIIEELAQIQKIPMAVDIRRRADFNLRQAEAENED